MCRMTLAMKLTWLRIILIVPGVTALFFGWSWAALAIFVVASATDWFDGRIARKTKTTSELGAFLDPLADKLLVYLYFGLLQSAGAYSVMLFLTMLARDMITDSFRSFAASRKISVPANMPSKIKAVLQMTSITLVLLVLSLSSSGFAMTSLHVKIIAVANLVMALALVSGIIGTVMYISRGKSVLR